MNAGNFQIGLNLRKKGDEAKSVSIKTTTVANVFGADSSDEEDADAAAKFEQKYAGTAHSKARNKRLLEKELAKQPDLFDYDAHYDEIQQQRDQKVASQKEADKEKKPKYAHLLVKAHKQRELSRLLVEENTYKKEREKEAGEFEDKEVFITGAYRQQIEEREQHKAEMEREEALEKMRDVRDQKMWQQAFNRTMLDNISRDYIDPTTSTTTMDEEDMKIEVKVEETIEVKIEGGAGAVEQQQGVKEEVGTNGAEYEGNRNNNGEEMHGSGHPEMEDPTRKRQNRSDVEVTKRKRSKREEELSEQEARMTRIREILSRRNDDAAIEEARQRYLERRARGEITAPH